MISLIIHDFSKSINVIKLGYLKYVFHDSEENPGSAMMRGGGGMGEGAVVEG